MLVKMKVTQCGLKNDGKAHPYRELNWFRLASLCGDICLHSDGKFGGKMAILSGRTSMLRCMIDSSCLDDCYAGMEAGHCR